jgi:hypothetical protein
MTWRRVLALLLTALVVAMSVTGLLTSPSAAVIGSLVGGVAFAAVGTVIVFHYPRHAVAWIMTILGVSWEISVVSPYYGDYARTHALPGLPVAASLSLWVYMVNLLLFFWLAILFPNGRIARGWTAIFWIGTAGTLVQGMEQMVAPGPSNVAHVSNPLALTHFPLVVDFVSSILAIGSLPAGAVCALLRLYRATGVERQQMKLFVYGVAVALSITTISIFTGWNGPIGDLASIALSLVPITVGAAILRYRLFDIDLIINRTLVYGSLTLTLGTLYVGVVVGLEALFRVATGQQSDLVIAIATLAVAGVFNPWRQRVQRFIDRRFYRHKYDAARVLESFSSRLRDEVEMERLTADLLSAAFESLQPSSVSLWVRGGAE